MRLIATATVLAFVSPAVAEPLTGPQIELTLEDITIWYEPLTETSARQFFSRNGQTPYMDGDGDKTFGIWLVRGDKYCSQWPPSDRFVCYGVERKTTPEGVTRITFISGGDGKRYTGIAKQGNHIDEAWAE